MGSIKVADIVNPHLRQAGRRPGRRLITADQAGALVDWVSASGKNLTTTYATHGHGDHFFGIGALLDRRNATPVATPDVVKVMRQQASPQSLASFWNPFPGQISDHLVIAEELTENVMDLGEVAVHLRHSKIHASDCAECETKEGMLDQIERDSPLKWIIDE